MLDVTDPTWPDVLSHPGDDQRRPMPLERHLAEVGQRGYEVTPRTATTAGGRPLREAAQILGIAHDAGKATEWFQSSLDDETPSGPSHHARFGSFLAYYALRVKGYSLHTRYAGLIAVAKHHGTLPDHHRFLETSVQQRQTWNVPEEAGGRQGSFNGATTLQAAHLETARPQFARAITERLVGDDGSWTDFLARMTASNGSIETLGPEPNESLQDWLAADFFGPRGLTIEETLFDDGATYLDALRLYSALTFADKTHAARIESDDPRLEAETLQVDQVRNHIDGLGGDVTGPLERRLNSVRDEIQQHVAGESEREDPIERVLDSDADVATLTLPTGYGKTLAGTLAAARFREATEGERIVYALPFTSVVDQTATTLRDVCRAGMDEPDATGRDVSPDPAKDRRLTVHHHLSEALTLTDDNGEESTEPTDEEADRATMLAESWRAGVTLTTFVQLFESIAGPRNSQSMKLPALYESVVVIDEPQALPLEWWPLVERLIDALVSEFEATVLLMTATQPRILDEERTEPILRQEVLDEIETSCFDTRPDRVEYEFHPSTSLSAEDHSEPLEYGRAAELLVDAVGNSKESVLAVCNTIDSAGDLLTQLTTALGEGEWVDVASGLHSKITRGGQVGIPGAETEQEYPEEFIDRVTECAGPERPAVVYLSTRLRPCDRRFLLSVIDRLTERDVPLAVVSTQLVEAGVDLSFDQVFRDFAPLDSIVQAAGRCNRSFERAPDTGLVTVWRLGPPSGRESIPGEVVYARRRGDSDLDLLAKTRDALTGVPVDDHVPENRIARESVRSYHESVGDAVQTVRADNELRQHFDRANGATLERASIIEEHLSFELYVCRTEAEYEVVENYRDAETAYRFDDARRLREELTDLRVSVPVYDPSSDVAQALKELEPLSHESERRDATERVLRTSTNEKFFDVRTGTEIPETTVEDRIL
jgi:CRISPR-associated endonuclease/helicase Cas3/CRISPR-associated endonuclease Cas3-HD